MEYLEIKWMKEIICKLHLEIQKWTMIDLENYKPNMN